MNAPADGPAQHGFTNAVVRAFLGSNLSIVLILLSTAVGLTAVWVTPREEDPQIVVPLADVYVDFPGRSAREVEQLVATPLEKLLYEIDGVEYVYSMSRENQAIITVRFYVGQDRERSLVKLFKRIAEHLDRVPAGVSGWVIKPVEIDDVPVITLTLSGAAGDEFTLRRIGEELVYRLAAVQDVSRAYVVGGSPRCLYVYLDPDRLPAYGLEPDDVRRAIQAGNAVFPAGAIERDDTVVTVETGRGFEQPDELRELVVGVSNDRPVYLKDVARVVDGPAELSSYVRHGWGPARGFAHRPGAVGTTLGDEPSHVSAPPADQADSLSAEPDLSRPAVTIALAKKQGTNAVAVAQRVLAAAGALRDEIVPDDVEMVVTRNYGLAADDKVNELINGLLIAVLIVIVLLTIGLGWREALIVAVAVPVVFGLTLAVNLLLGFSINRVTLFALILSLGLLVDDPIVDVENISRHFATRPRTRRTVLEAVAEIRPPLIVATLAVIVSFLPMFFITGMMGPYMRPMALNVPVTMFMSMVVAFTITPWLSYHLLKRAGAHVAGTIGPAGEGRGHDSAFDAGSLRRTPLFRLFAPLILPLLAAPWRAWAFLAAIGGLTLAAVGLAAARAVPLKMLPFDNKNELLLVLDFPEGTTLERSDAAVRGFERELARVPEVTDFVSYVGLASPIDFNGLVRHYYLRRGPHVAEIRVNLVDKLARRSQSHAVGLRLRDALTALARQHDAALKIVEIPPGPPVIATLVAEVYGRAEQPYEELAAAARVVRARMASEPGVVDVDDSLESAAAVRRLVVDREKAALHGVTVQQISQVLQTAVDGATVEVLRQPDERNPLPIVLRMPREQRSGENQLASIQLRGRAGRLIPLAELGRWEERRVDQTIYHKNLLPLVYVFAETAGRAPAEAIVDIQADQRTSGADEARLGSPPGRPLSERSFLSNGGGRPWSVSEGIRVEFAGEGEWQITLDVFRDLGLAFAGALVGIYVLLVAQMGSFLIPVVVMLAIPLTILGVMPGFWLLNTLAGGAVGGYPDPTFFTATGMIGMIALAGIVTRQAVIIVDFVHLSLRRGLSLTDAILASCVVRLRPILLTVGAAMLSAAPITIDPIFSGLAWALIFGLFASTLFTLLVIPVAYWLLYRNVPGHGVALESE